MTASTFDNYFIVLTTTVVALNSVSIPLGYYIITYNLKPYLDKNIYNRFLEEDRFKCNIIVSLFCFGFFVFPLLFNIDNLFYSGSIKEISAVLEKAYVGFSIFCIIGFLMAFINYSKMIYDYAANTEEMLFDQIKKDIDDYLKTEN